MRYAPASGMLDGLWRTMGDEGGRDQVTALWAAELLDLADTSRAI
ncbi:MAG: hypothetical protein ACM3XM_03235 [Mycobacterium leprae]